MQNIEMVMRAGSTVDCLDVDRERSQAKFSESEEAKSLRELFVKEDMNKKMSTPSLDLAAQKVCISRDKYVASRQEFLRSYKLSTEKESVGKRTKKWFKDKKTKSPLRFLLCVAPKLDVHD